jgi:DNA invertase Pin-like site-specific DNA recombinase
MPRTFAYVRVSTPGQTSENQIHEIEAAGFAVSARHHRGWQKQSDCTAHRSFADSAAGL